MLDRVSPAERDRALKSLALLEDVHNRVVELRTAGLHPGHRGRGRIFG